MNIRPRRFPLKMKDGTEIRTYEDLCVKADTESILINFFNGQLERWLCAYNLEGKTEHFYDIYKNLIISLYNSVGITPDDEKIEEYIRVGRLAEDSFEVDDTEEDIIDDEDLKAKLCEYCAENAAHLDEKGLSITAADLNDIELSSVYESAADSEPEKYHVTMRNIKTGQYMGFYIPCGNAEGDKTELYKKIIHSIHLLKEQEKYNTTVFSVTEGDTFTIDRTGTDWSLPAKPAESGRSRTDANWTPPPKAPEASNGRTSTPGKPTARSVTEYDTFTMGKWASKPIEWIVIRNDRDGYLCIAKDIITEKRYAPVTNEWQKSELRDWLNGEFLSQAFGSAEKEWLIPIEGDNVSLLTYPQAVTTERNYLKTRISWWLQTPAGILKVRYIKADGTIINDGDFVASNLGVRPVIKVRYIVDDSDEVIVADGVIKIMVDEKPDED